MNERIQSYLDKVDPAIAGQNGSSKTLWVASRLVNVFGLSAEDAWPWLCRYNERCVPPWSENDLRRKLAEACRGSSNAQSERAYPKSGETASASPLEGVTAWPARNLDEINCIIKDGPGLYDLWEASPVRFEDGQSHAEDIVDVLFPGNPLLCCARTPGEFASRRREVWRGHLSQLPLMVPNPMHAIKGITKAGYPSEHSQDNTAQRVYLCIEFDFAEGDLAVPITDACAALILHLKNKHLNTLVAVCFSGGKSLHAWFRVLDVLKPGEQYSFMQRAVALGADRATWNKSQFVRIPDGSRANGSRQTAYYLDAKEAVQL